MYIGLDIGGTNMVAGLTNGAGKIINKVSRPVNKAWDPAELCRQSAQLAQQAAEVGGFAADQIKAVGLGLPGLVDNKTGYVIQTPNMPFDNTPIREMFQAEWDVPVYLGNDGNLLEERADNAHALQVGNPILTWAPASEAAWWWAASCTPASPSPGWRWAT